MVKRDYTDWITSILIICCGIIVAVASIKGIQLDQQIQQLSHQIQALGGAPPDADVSRDYAIDYIGIFMSIGSFIWGFFRGRFAYRRERQRQLAARGDTETVPLAAEQPELDDTGLDVPTTLVWRLHPSIFRILWGFYLVSCILPILIWNISDFFLGVFPLNLGTSFQIAGFLFAGIAIPNLTIAFLVHRSMEVTEKGLIIHRRGSTRLLRWEDIRLFVNFYHGSTTGEDRYQLASASMIFGWQDPLSSHSILNQTLQNSPDEVNAPPSTDRSQNRLAALSILKDIKPSTTGRCPSSQSSDVEVGECKCCIRPKAEQISRLIHAILIEERSYKSLTQDFDIALYQAPGGRVPVITIGEVIFGLALDKRG